MAIDLRKQSERTINQRWIPLNYAIAINQQYMPADGELVIATNTPGFGTRRIQLLGTPYNTTRNKTIAELYADFLQTPTAQEVMAAVQAETSARTQADASLQAQINSVKQGANIALPFQNLTDFNAWLNNGTLPAFWAQMSPPLTWKPVDARVGWLALFIETDITDKWYAGAEWLDQEISIDLSGYLTEEQAAQIYAPVDSPALAGRPTAPIPDLEDAPDNQIAVIKNTRLVYNLVRGLLSGLYRQDDDGKIYQYDDEGNMLLKQDETEVR